MKPIDFSVGKSLSEARLYNTHRCIGLNELRQLARTKREESVRSGAVFQYHIWQDRSGSNNFVLVSQ